MRHLNLALGLLLLTGCAGFNSGWNTYSPSSTYYNDPYSRSDVDELLGFGATMARIPPSSRAETCRILLKRQKDSTHPLAGIQLHLMVGRLLSDSCGDIPRILNGVAAIPPGQMTDDLTRKLVDLHTEALKRLNGSARRYGSAERRHKPAAGEREPNETSGATKDENRLLREKLEAIRSMEKQMDQSGDAN